MIGLESRRSLVFLALIDGSDFMGAGTLEVSPMTTPKSDARHKRRKIMSG